MTVTLKRKHAPFFIAVIALSLIGSSLWFMEPFLVTRAEKIPEVQVQKETAGKHIVVNLDKQTVTLTDGTSTPLILPILSQGKPGSYYETIGGTYISDYKTPLQFSSIGHVYMPYSVHVFGQYFIHGVPYYPNGENVSTAYSGGCVRLTNDNAKIVYDFVDTKTRVTITREDERSFDPTKKETETLESEKLTLLMVAAISLETLTQDNTITTFDGRVTTRKETLPELIIRGNKQIAKLYAQEMGETAYVDLMNKKALALGLSNTHFTDISSPVITSYDDYVRFMTYISTYKSYLLTLKEDNRK